MIARSSGYDRLPATASCSDVGQDIVYGIGIVGVVLIVLLLLGAIPMIPDLYRYLKIKNM